MKKETVQLDNPAEKYLPFILEIRKRLFFIIAAFFIASGLGFFYYENIIKIILKVFNLEGVNIVFTSPFQFLSLAIAVGFCIGLLIIFPLIIYQTLSFLKPALNRHEFRAIIFLLPLSSILFVSGFSLGVLTMRYVLVVFYTKSQSLDIGNFLDISTLLSQTLITSALMGLAFQLPIILTILMRLGILKYQDLVKKRIIAYGLSLIFAALLPPTDLLSLALLFLPIASLFELTLLLNRYVLKSHLL